MRSRPIALSSDAPSTTPWWGVALTIAAVTAGLGVIVLRPWQGPVTGPSRDAWGTLLQVGLMVQLMVTWAAPELSGVRHRFAARAAAAGLGLQLASTVWLYEISPRLGVHLDTIQAGRTILGASSGVCLIALVASLTRRSEQFNGNDRNAMVDAAVVGAAAAVVAWEALAVDVGAGRLAVSAATAATVTVTVATAIFVRLMLSTASRLLAIRLLAVALVLSMVVVLQYVGNGMANSPALDYEWEVVALLVYGTIAAAVLHPSFRTLVDDGARGPATPHGIARAVTLSAAVIVPSGVTLFRALGAARDSASDWSIAMSVPPAFAGVAITFGVAWRLAQLVREREETHRLLRHRSLHDDLTGLPNRAYLLERLERQIARLHSSPANADIGFGLMFLDLDGFKSINDTYGHHAGDAVLVDVAHRLGDTVRTDDFIGRMAGDEFVLLCGQPWDEPSLEDLAERIREAVEAPLPAEFGVVTPKVSIGIVAVDRDMARARDAVSAILREADSRMYKRKAASRLPVDPTPPTHRRPDPGIPAAAPTTDRDRTRPVP